MKAIPLNIVLAVLSAAPCACALDTIEFDKDYKGSILELEGPLLAIQGDGKSLDLTIELPSPKGTETFVRATIVDAHTIDYDSLLKNKAAIRVKGKCSGCHMNTPKQKYVTMYQLSCEIGGVQIKETPKPKMEDSPVIALDEEKIRKSLVKVVGGPYLCTGFVASYKGRKVIITRAHAFLEGKVVISSSQTQINASEFAFARDRDMAIIEAPDTCAIPPLELEGDISILEHEHPISVISAMAMATPEATKGKIIGVGPQNLEVSAPINPDNAGSPIISLRTGKAVGIACHSVGSRPTFSTKGTRFEEERKFGLRIDSLKAEDLQPIDQKKLDSDLNSFATAFSANKLAFTILSDIYETGSPSLSPSKYDIKKYPSLMIAIKDWNEALLKGPKGEFDSILKRLKSQISSPLANVRPKNINYDWVRSEIERQLDLNSYYCKVFDGLSKDVEELRRLK